MTWKLDPFSYARRPTRTVHVGDVTVGGSSPIRVQSMTTPATTDTAATVTQIVRLVESGCEIVRVTVPTSADAENLPIIRRELAERGVRVPLVADIHFTPAAALKAVEHVEKVRINPGNFADKKKFAVREYTDAEYTAELARIERVFSPLVKRCKELGVSMRIGTNHGSLSDRILNRFGDTPEGMVESALEFVRICEAHGYRELILSMKASNPVVVLGAYRLLATRMAAEGMDYPFHLGVTEAGDGEDGRIKSAIGIGALLAEGIGDTVRVSLTEDPVAEIPVARALVAPYNELLARGATGIAGLQAQLAEAWSPFVYERRASRPVRVGPREIGGRGPGPVAVPLRTPLSDADDIRRELDAQSGVRVPQETRAEVVSVEVARAADVEAAARLRESMELVAPAVALSAHCVGRLDLDLLDRLFGVVHRVHVTIEDAPGREILPRLLERSASSRASLLVEAGCARGGMEDAVDLAVEAARLARSMDPARLVLAIDPRLGFSPLQSMRLLAARLTEARLDPPLVLLDRAARRGAEALLGSSTVLGGLLCEGIGDSIQLETESAAESRKLAFSILQAARVRMTRTEFISCPSCGRTLFDLETTTARIKHRTAHLKGLKIAVMGCIVNGPGEMADADFGYVGWGDDKIALFVGKELVERNIPTEQADERLVELIKRHGKWVDPPVPVSEEA